MNGWSIFFLFCIMLLFYLMRAKSKHIDLLYKEITQMKEYVKNKEYEIRRLKLETKMLKNYKNSLVELQKTYVTKETAKGIFKNYMRLHNKIYEFNKKADQYNKNSIEHQKDDRELIIALNLRILRLEKKIYGKSLDENLDHQTRVDETIKKEEESNMLQNSMFKYLPTYNRKYPS